MSSITRVPGTNLLINPPSFTTAARQRNTLNIGVNVELWLLDGGAHAGSCREMADVCDGDAIRKGPFKHRAHARPVADVQVVDGQPSRPPFHANSAISAIVFISTIVANNHHHRIG